MLDPPTSAKKLSPITWFKKKVEERSHNWDTIGSLGSLLSGAGVLSTRNKQVKEICKAYKFSKHPIYCMNSLVHIYVDNMLEGNDLRIRVNKCFTKCSKAIDVIARKIPDIITADCELIVKKEGEIQKAKKKINKDFPDLLHIRRKLQNKLDAFFVDKVMEMDFQMQDINYNSSRDFLGSGSFAGFYKGKLVCSTKAQNVTLKIGIMGENISDFLQEDRLMR